jgi:hypothetical protein
MNPKRISRLIVPCCIVLGSVLVATAPLFAVQDSTSPADATPHSTRQAAASQKSHDPEDEGQRVFDQNCARCHTAPDGFSTRISGTIVRHMRVRANLSRHDEEVLLHYFNP